MNPKVKILPDQEWKSLEQSLGAKVQYTVISDGPFVSRCIYQKDETYPDQANTPVIYIKLSHAEEFINK